MFAWVTFLHASLHARHNILLVAACSCLVPGPVIEEANVGAFEQTEIKTVLDEGKVIIYNWQVVDDKKVYFDFHGHEESFGPDFFVRYKERQEGLSKSSGSLTAPFYGEHGWLFFNINEEPISITLNVTGYYNEIIDYGIF